MDPIEHLLDEHRVIMAQIADLRKAVADLAVRGNAALPDVLPVLGRIGKMMATQLALHAKKEDDALFPALEAIVGAGGSPTEVMGRTQIHGRADFPPNLRAQRSRAPKMSGGRVRRGNGRQRGIIKANASHPPARHAFGERANLFPMAENM
jgi:hypothetical protein